MASEYMKKLIIIVDGASALAEATQDLLFKAGYKWPVSGTNYHSAFKYVGSQRGIRAKETGSLACGTASFYKNSSRYPDYVRFDAATQWGALIEFLLGKPEEDIILSAGHIIPDGGYSVGGTSARVYLDKKEGYAQVGCVRASLAQLKEIVERLEQ